MANDRKKPEVDYNKDTVYVVGNDASSPVKGVSNMDGSQYYQPQYYTQSQLNNNMSGTDANAIYQATHDPNFAAQYSQPYMQQYEADLARMGLQPYTGQQRPDMNPNTYVTGAGAFMVPNPYRSDVPESFEQVLPRGYGSTEGIGGLGIPSSRDTGGEAASQYYADILNALLQSGGTTPGNAHRIQHAMDEARFW